MGDGTFGASRERLAPALSIRLASRFLRIFFSHGASMFLQFYLDVIFGIITNNYQSWFQTISSTWFRAFAILSQEGKKVSTTLTINSSILLISIVLNIVSSPSYKVKNNRVGTNLEGQWRQKYLSHDKNQNDLITTENMTYCIREIYSCDGALPLSEMKYWCCG